MTDQLALIPPPPQRLSPRQQKTLAFLTGSGGADHETLGAYVHHLRSLDGHNGHPADARCRWCVDEGKQMGGALRAKGHVRYSRKHEVWLPKDAPDPTPADATPGPGDLPEGF